MISVAGEQEHLLLVDSPDATGELFLIQEGSSYMFVRYCRFQATEWCLAINTTQVVGLREEF